MSSNKKACIWHEGEESVSWSPDEFTCESCGAWLAACVCRACELPFPDYDYEEESDLVKQPCKNRTHGYLCEECWDWADDEIRAKHEHDTWDHFEPEVWEES